jgi:hypothetical protein
VALDVAVPGQILHNHNVPRPELALAPVGHLQLGPAVHEYRQLASGGGVVVGEVVGWTLAQVYWALAPAIDYFGRLVRGVGSAK